VAITEGSITNANNANYDITFVDGTLTINRKGITVTADDQVKTYGAANPDLTVTVTEDLTGLAAVTGSAATTATTSTAVGSVAITEGSITNANNANYDITFVDGTLTINRKGITVTADDQVKTYGAANPDLTVTVTEDLTGLAAVTGSAATTATTSTGVGSVAITEGSITNANNANYDITFVDGTLTINRKGITVTADDQVKTYGAANPDLTVTVTEDLTGLAAVTGSAATTATTSTGVGSVAITEGSITNANNANYDITFVDGTLTINRKGITVTADDQVKTYGAANPDLTVTVTEDLTGLAAVTGSAATTATTSTGVGSVAITEGSITNANNANYDITFVDGTLTINRKGITVTADDQVKTYGAANPDLTVTVTEDLTGLAAVTGSAATTATTSTGVGSVAITEGSITNANNANYDITFVDGTLTINRKGITVTADDQAKTYGAANPDLTVTVTEDLTGLAAVTGSAATTATTSTGVGSVAITEGSITNANNANYDITFVDGTLTINRKGITVTADDQAKTYGAANPDLTVTVTEDLTGLAAVTGSAATTATTSTGVGSVAITEGSITNANNANYDITFVDGTLTINRKGITVTADDQAKTYGAANPDLTVTVTEDLTGLAAVTGSAATTATTSTGVGSVAITEGSITNANNANYDITFVDGTLTINRKGITVTADDQAKTYGAANPDLTVTVTEDLTGLAAVTGSAATTATTSTGVGSVAITEGSITNANNANYDITFVDGTLTINRKGITVTADDQAKTYGAANPDLTVTVTEDLTGLAAVTGSAATTATTSTGVGSVAITEGSITNANNANYDITFVDGTLTINRKGITVTADDQAKTYGAANPDLTVTVTEDLTGLAAVTGSAATTATTSTGVGSVAITEGSITNANNANYDITFVDGTLTINRKGITVTADDQVKTYGAANPDLTVTVTEDLTGLAAVTGSAATTATTSTGVGSVAITEGSITNANNANYDITFVDGTLTINRKGITVTADDQVKTYGAANPDLTVTVTEDLTV
jgi:serine kinase of HPr protein (carbohydrate metabolism regulator)